jgi:hypothetical protein
MRARAAAEQGGEACGGVAQGDPGGMRRGTGRPGVIECAPELDDPVAQHGMLSVGLGAVGEV